MDVWLVHVMRLADGALSQGEALRVVMDRLDRHLPCQSAAIILIDDETKALRVLASRRISDAFLGGLPQVSPEPTAERVLLEQQPMLLNNMDPASDVYSGLKMERDFTSAMLAPIVSNQRGVGYIFSDRAGPKPFDESDLLHLQVIGHLIGNILVKFDLIESDHSQSPLDSATKALQYRAFVPILTGELHRAEARHLPVTLALLAAAEWPRRMGEGDAEAARCTLARVASMVRQEIGDRDVLGRYGADTLILCLPGIAQPEAGQQLRRLQETVARQLAAPERPRPALTVGALVLEKEGDAARGLQDVLGALGRRLVSAKTAGPGGFAIGAMA